MFSAVRRANLYLNLFGFSKVPLIWLCRPKILAIDDQHVEVRIPLKQEPRIILIVCILEHWLLGQMLLVAFLL